MKILNKNITIKRSNFWKVNQSGYFHAPILTLSVGKGGFILYLLLIQITVEPLEKL